MPKVLIAVDGSPGSERALSYVAAVFAGMEDCRLVLFHVLPVTSRLLLDKEAIAAIDADKIDRRDLDGVYWSPDDQVRMQEIFSRARALLEAGGVPPDRISTKFRVGAKIAEAILEEAAEGGFDTVVVGRRGLSRIKEFFMGSVSAKVVREARGCTVWVVD